MAAKKRKILLVEDEAVGRESVRDWMVEDGYDVECVESGEEALERMKKEEFGVVVLSARRISLLLWGGFFVLRNFSLGLGGLPTY